MLLDRVITELLGLDRELERELDLDTVETSIIAASLCCSPGEAGAGSGPHPGGAGARPAQERAQWHSVLAGYHGAARTSFPISCLTVYYTQLA